jgi:hypothetical protein
MGITNYTENATKNHTLKVICKECQRETNHLVAASVETAGFEKEYDIHWSAVYQIIKCQGCDTFSFRIENSDSEIWSEIEPFMETIYPKRSDKILANKLFYNLPFNINRLYRETIDCYNNEILILCAAGIRALVEAICFENKISDGIIEIKEQNGTIKSERRESLEGKINGLSEKGILTKENTIVLHEHRLLGNEALHRMTAPNKEGLSIAITIIENILESIYEIPFKKMKLQQARGKI